jgi:hypothetical protein
MTDTIRRAYSNWPRYNAALRDVVAGLDEELLALRPTPERWPLWATVGHLACQRISGWSGQLDVPGGEATPFPDALWRCPGDEYLEPAMNAQELAAALDSTFRVIDTGLDTITLDSLDEEIVRRFGDDEWRYTRGSVIQRSFAHDISHIAELNESLSRAGGRTVDLWD